MANPSALLVVMAHPDDESMDCGGIIVRHTRAGVKTHLICATYGEAGWTGKPPGARREDLAERRAGELEQAAHALGLARVDLWDYPDGSVAVSDRQEITVRIWEEISRLRPRAVVSWGPDGGDGHQDHVAIGACTDAAVAAMAEGDRPALYHVAVDEKLAGFYRDAVRLGGGGTQPQLIPQDRVDVVIELQPDEVMMKLRAIDCHQSQLEDWRIAIRKHPTLMRTGYGREPYIAVFTRFKVLTRRGLLGEFG
ncbi:MAG: PIG-L deacetylase family protein [Candidatus Dormibacterales bacterium]